jgi:hypothetical protein
MRKIFAIGIIAILLCSVIAVLVQAQSVPTTSMADTNNIQTTTINNSWFMSLSVDERMALGQTAIDNYLSGKTDKLIIPGGTIVVPPQTPPPNGLRVPDVWRNVPRPDFSNTSLIKSQPQFSTTPPGGVSPLYTTMRLPCTGNVTSDWDHGHYIATYVGFGGMPDFGTNISSVEAKFNFAYPNTLSYLGAGDKEIYVLHLWGNNQSGSGGSENNLYIMRDPYNTNLIDFIYWAVDKQITVASLPQTDRIMGYIMALTPMGSSAYTQIQICVYDATTGTWYQPANINTAVPQWANNGDVALECVGDYTQHLNDWKVAENFKAYTVNQQPKDLYQGGHVYYYYYPSTTSPSAWSAYYFDPETYFGVPNGQANIFITRYALGSSYPLHP